MALGISCVFMISNFRRVKCCSTVWPVISRYWHSNLYGRLSTTILVKLSRQKSAVYCLHFLFFSPEKNMQVLKDVPLLQSSDSFIWWCYINLRYDFCLVRNQLLWKGFVAISPANLKIEENFVKKQGRKCMKQVWGNKLAVPVDMHMVEFSLKGFLSESMIAQRCAVAQWVVCRVFALETGVQVLWQAFFSQQLF